MIDCSCCLYTIVQPPLSRRLPVVGFNYHRLLTENVGQHEHGGGRGVFGLKKVLGEFD